MSALAWLLAAAPLAVAGAPACGGGPTAIVVEIRSELPAGAATDLRLEVEGTADLALVPSAGEPLAPGVVERVALVPRGEVSRTFAVEAVALDRGAVVASRRARTRFWPHHAVLLALPLQASCVATRIACRPDETCIDGACAPVPEVAPSGLPPWRDPGGVPGARPPTAGPADAGLATEANGPPRTEARNAWIGEPRIVLVGRGGRRLVSRDGITFTDDVQDRKAIAGDKVDPKALNDVLYAGGLVVAVGGGCENGCSPRIMTLDGATWTDVPVPATTGWLGGVAHGGGTWVAVGAAATQGPLLSADGTRWARAPTKAAADLRAVEFGLVGGRQAFVAAGDGAARAHSFDGRIWSAPVRELPGTTALPNLLTVGFGGGVALAGGDAGTLVRSVDLPEWSHQSVGRKIGSIVYVDGRLLAYHPGGSFTSSDGGATWSPEATENGPGSTVATAVFRGARLFVGISWPDTIKTSVDGRRWVTRYEGSPDHNPLVAITFAGGP